MNQNKLKIFLLGDLHSSHFTKWVNGLISRNIKVYVFTFGKKDDTKSIDGAEIFYCGFQYDFLNFEKEGSLKKIKLLFLLPYLFYLLRKVKPDIVHAHYASSYGFLGALSFYHPYIVSVWGSDIFSFPKTSVLHKSLIKFALKKADVILATSKALAMETGNYAKGEILITPFGIDIGKFSKLRGTIPGDKITIGTIKKLEKIYGIDILLKIFSKLKEYNKPGSIKLFIAGEGTQESSLKQLAHKLGIKEDVVFAGKMPYENIEKVHNTIDIFANLSRSESFGVAVLEASSCEVPVVASNVGGLVDVVKNEVTGYLVAPDNEQEIINAFQELINSEDLRKKMGQAGRQMVIEKYNWEENLMEMIRIYEKTC